MDGNDILGTCLLATKGFAGTLRSREACGGSSVGWDFLLLLFVATSIVADVFFFSLRGAPVAAIMLLLMVL